RAFLRISRIRRTAHHDREDIRYAELGVEGIERPDEARRVARRHAYELGAEAFLVIRRGVERKIRQRVFLAPLPDRLDAGLFVQGLVSAVLRGAVDDEVGGPHEIAEGAGDLDARLLEFRSGVLGGGIQRIPIAYGHLGLEVGPGFGDPDDAHVFLT